MPKRDLSQFIPPIDPAKHAAGVLNSVLEKTGTQSQSPASEDTLARMENAWGHIEAGKALTGGSVLERSASGRSLRLLILSRDLALFEGGSLAQNQLLELAERFSEVHVIVLSVTGTGSKVPLRIQNQVWVYPTYSKYWWKTGFDAYRIAEEQLSFAQGFRADLVIAHDPFESGVAAHFIAKKYERPLQIHVREDFYDPHFKLLDEHNSLRVFVASYALSHAESIRTKTAYIRERLISEDPHLEKRTEVLPNYINLKAWRDAVPAFSLEMRYPQFKFIIVHISQMTKASHTQEVINGTLRLLSQYPMMGLVIVGSGPLRATYEKYVTELKMTRQIIFEPMPDEVLSHLKTAHVCIHLSIDDAESHIPLMAAAAKIPMIINAEAGKEIFKDNESAFLCGATDVECVGARLNTFLNQNALRTSFGDEAENAIFTHIEQDFESYMDAYAGSIERSFAQAS